MGNKQEARSTKRPRWPGKVPVPKGDGSILKTPAPDFASFVDPFDDTVLLAYYHEIARWHGYIRFLGLPHLRDNPDVPIDRLYVEPSISDSHIQPQQPTDNWPETTHVLETIAASQRLVLLGDPGSGKSTLVSWIAWQLTQPGDNAWTKRLRRLVPIPMILRDMKLGPDLSWDGLLDAFLALPVAKALDADGKGRERLHGLIARGQAIVMLDGLDEIGSPPVRLALQAAVFEGIGEVTPSRWLLTSRIVGYEVFPFHATTDREANLQADRGADFKLLDHEIQICNLVYVAPFSDVQIEQFAHNWYVQHEQSEHERQQRAGELIKAIASNEGTRHLARIPNLLTLIALIYRVSRWLPHGRALLYDRIAEAYLESIDRFRGLDGLNYPLAQKKRWLAYVGFQMQKRRGKASDSGDREILVDEDQVHRWIAEAMGGGAADAENSAKRFVDYIARRSGLLLPRGEGQFAFTHLSLQEYFAACHCLEQVTAPRWLEGKARNPTLRPEDLRAFTNDAIWRETLILLFELLADRPGWPDDLLECVYGEDFAELADDPMRERKNAAFLLADVAFDRHGGLSADCREKAVTACWRWELVAQQKEGYSVDRNRNRMARYLCSPSRKEFAEIWVAFKIAVQRKGNLGALETLDLWDTKISDTDLQHLAAVTTLQLLDLGGTPLSGAGFVHLTAMAKLESLYLYHLPQVTDAGLAHLAGIKTLKALNMRRCNKITDAGLAHLSALTGLQTLNLSSCKKITDAGLAHLSALTGLQTLNIMNCNMITDAGLAHLSPLTDLQTLNIRNCNMITDAGLAHLSPLTDLQTLDISGCDKITDAGLAHLSRCTKLVDLGTVSTKVTEAGKRRFLKSLQR